ncbi:putative NADH-flavin reductase [Gorgonomyces haynaldii]|nr:putative NADH-flavin reductase [Gorgonomyces haynaldii]
MKLAVFGGTRGVGRAFVEQTYDKHQLVCLARSPEKLQDFQVKTITGSVLDKQAVRETVDGVDAVVISLGATIGAKGDDLTVCSQGTRLILDVLKELGQKPKLLVVTSLGCGDSYSTMSLVGKMMVWFFLSSLIKDKDIQEDLVVKSGIPYTIVRPGGLSDGEATGQYKIGKSVQDASNRVSRKNVAHFLATQIQSNEYLNQTVVQLE